MNGALQVTVDLDAGEVRLGPLRVLLLTPVSDRPSPSPAEVFHLNDLRGPLVRALFFEERSLLVANAPYSDIARRIAEAALVAPGYAPKHERDAIRIAVSLALAGGAEEAPSFSDCCVLAAQQEGWDGHRVSESPALLVDRVCGKLRRHFPADGWKRVIFQEPEADLETLVSLMVANLSRRAESVTGDEPEPETTFSPDEAENTNIRFQSRPSSSVEGDFDSVEPRAAAIAVEPHGVPRSQSFSSVSVADRRSTELSAPSAAAWPISIAETVTASVSPAPARARQASRGPATSRVSARVLAPNHDSSPRTQATTLPPTASISSRTEKSRIAYSTSDHVQPTTMPTGPAAAKQASLTFSPVASAAPEPSAAAFQSVAFNPRERSFPPLLRETEAPRAAFQTEIRAESPSFSGWLAELAALLEAECDLRGID